MLRHLPVRARRAVSLQARRLSAPYRHANGAGAGAYPARRLALAACLVVAFPGLSPAQGTAAPASTGEPWSIVRPPESSKVFARDGALVGEIGPEWRTNIPLRTLPDYVPQAFIAIEDQRFYQHDGVDIVGLAGAIKDAVRGNPRGASTITQQLVGNMHPDVIDRSDISLARKLREQAAAREMEKHYSKAQILEAYLNQIHFGHRWYGIESAARHYFGKGAAALTVAEAATLAALPKGPALYDPINHPDRALARRNLVLSLMAEQGYLTKEQAATAQHEATHLAPDAGFAAPSPYYVDVVRIQAERAGIPVTRGGYRIYTVLDPAVQRAATEALDEGTADIEQQPGYRHPTFAQRRRGRSDYLQGAIVALDPFTGDVRALVGGRNYAASSFNRAVDGRRQPGSAFKAMVYAAAVSDSIAPNAIVPDTALAIPLPDHTVYRPENADGAYLGPITMREALIHSRNVVAVQLAERLGIDSVIATARRMGLSSPIAPVPASAIGASVVQPLDLVSVYAAIDNLGARVEPRFIAWIEDDQGRTIWQNPIATPQQVLDPQVAFIVRDMMRDVVERGTATAVRRYVPPSVPVAGKTGTTNDNTDVWFVGMTTDLVAGVWLGFDTPKSIGPGAAGGTLAAPIWGRMLELSGGPRGGPPWVPPPTLVQAQLDRATGTLADSLTPPARRYTEYFLPGTEPIFTRLDSWELFLGRRPVVR